MAGTDRSRAHIVGGPRIILVEPQLGENIGAAARAMLNCGLVDLALVAPREPWPNDKAQAMASGADVVLDEAILFDTVEDAVADLKWVYATSARPRDMTKRVLRPHAAVAEIRDNGDQQTGFLFGPERSGLSNSHMALADAAISVPVNPAYASLNLAQAVLIIGYEWFKAMADTPGHIKGNVVTHDKATKADISAFLGRLESHLERHGFFRSEDMRPTVTRNLRNLFQRIGLTEQEVRTLQGVLSALTGRGGSNR